MMHQHLVTEADLADRVDALAVRVFEGVATRAGAKKAIKRGLLRIDGEPARSAWFPRLGQVLSYHPDRRIHPVNSLHPTVIYADEHLGVVVKPAGVLTNGNRHRTLERGLPNVLEMLDGYPPHPAHRLDYETAGLVLCGRTPAALRAISAAFEARKILKRYRAIVVGRIEEAGQVAEPLDGRDALTRFRPVQHTPSLKVRWTTELEVWPETGRMHQIRRHLASLGHAVLGDARYPTGPVYKGNGLFLAAVGLEFAHPITGAALHLVGPVPQKFATLQAREVRRWNRWHGSATVRPEGDDASDR